MWGRMADLKASVTSTVYSASEKAASTAGPGSVKAASALKAKLGYHDVMTQARPSCHRDFQAWPRVAAAPPHSNAVRRCAPKATR